MSVGVFDLPVLLSQCPPHPLYHLGWSWSSFQLVPVSASAPLRPAGLPAISQQTGVEANRYYYQTVTDGVAHSKNPRKCAYHVTFDLDLDLEHTLDTGLPGEHRVQVWWRSGHLSARRSDLRKSLQTDRRTDRRRTPRHCISSFLERANKPEMEMGQWVMGHGSNGSPFSGWVTWVNGSLPATH